MNEEDQKAYDATIAKEAEDRARLQEAEAKQRAEGKSEKVTLGPDDIDALLSQS
jgi:hypothetical protein